jgi:Tol biopolymer transport system component
MVLATQRRSAGTRDGASGFFRPPRNGSLGMDAGYSQADPAGNRGDRDVVSPNELDRELERILASRTFARSRRLQDLLRYTVDRIKTGRADSIKEYLLAVEVFGRKPSFDPRFDSIVRVQASRLREKLQKYYATEGRGDEILIAIPKGAYIPTVQHRRQRLPSAYKRRWLWIAGAALFSGAVLWLAILQLQTSGRHPPVLRRLTSDAGFTGYPAVSQDGKWIAFASDRNGGGRFAVWVTPATDASAARQLTDDEANDYEPAFSPDSRHIVYRSDRDGGGIYIIPVAGGQSKLIAARGRRPRFSPDGSRIVYWERDETWGPGRIYTVPSTGGDPTPLVPDFADAHYPVWSPDGSEVLFCGTRITDQPSAGHDWWVLHLSSGEVIKTGAANVLSRAVPPAGRRLAGFSADILGVPGGWVEGRIIFSTRLGDSENLWEFRITPDRRIASVPRRLTFGADMEAQPSAWGNRVAFVSGSLNINVWMSPAESNRGRLLEVPHRITDDAGPFALSPSVSSDGSKLAFISTRAGSRDVWFRDLATERGIPLTATPAVEEGYPSLSEDGSQVAYRVIEDPKQPIYLMDTRGGTPRKICNNCGLPTDWSHDCRWLLFEPGARIPGIGLLDVSSGSAREIAVHATYKLHSARFSPDDRWVAFHAETGVYTRRIFVARLQGETLGGESQWIPITAGTDLDIAPAWSPDGNLLYFISERDSFRCIWAQRLHPDSRIPVGPPFAVQHFHSGARALLKNFRANPLQIGLSISERGIVYSQEELRGNIWTMEMQ